MGRLIRRLKAVTEASYWRHWFWRHRHRRLTIVISVIAVVVTFILIHLQNWRITFGQPSVEIRRSFHPSFPSFSSLSSSSFFSLFSSVSPSSLPLSESQPAYLSSPLASVSRSHFSSIFSVLHLLHPRSFPSSSTSEPHNQPISGVWSRSSSALPPTLQILDVQSITDVRYSEYVKNPIEYRNCTQSSPTPPLLLSTPSDSIPPLEEQSMPRPWQRMEVTASPGQSTVSYLFAAYYDSRSRPPNVVIVGVTSNFYHFFVNSSSNMVAVKYFCQFRYWNSSQLEATTAVFSFAAETHGKRYAASFHICYIRHDKIPYAVSLVTDQCVSSPSNLLRVQFNQMPSQQPERDFTVCVTPLNNNYDNYQQLVEMIEVNRMFGAQKFVFYNYSTGTDILPYLRSYEEEGIVEVVPWRLPVNADLWPDDPRVVPEVHYFGQVAALNDCLYRNMLVSRFVVFTDLDEIIVPRGRHTTWAEVLDAATRRMLGNPPFNQTQAFPGAYVIQNTFFRSDWGDDSRANEDQVARDLKLRTLLKTKREAIIYRWYFRSKLIVWTKAVFTVGIHSVSGFVDDGKVVAVKVAADDALLHHYRLNMWPDDPKNPPQPTQDRHMHSFYDEITNRTLDRHNRVRQ